MTMQQPIGIFDSGYGGLTILKDIVDKLPQYDYIYMGDNARTPYGTRSFDTVYHYTLECVQWFFKQGCSLIVLACNTASAKALRTIQQNDLESIAPGKKVLGVIRPTTELTGMYTQTNKVGVLATTGTVLSGSYPIEINKFFPQVQVYQQACPMWVPLVENDEYNTPGADYFVKESINKLLQQAPGIDTILLGCTHYPLLMPKIQQYLPAGIKVVSQGAIVATSLTDYLLRHPEIEQECSKSGKVTFYTTDSAENFNKAAAIFFGKEVKSQHIVL
jgi:glutamate racemase